jgi:hypothetical protein
VFADAAAAERRHVGQASVKVLLPRTVGSWTTYALCGFVFATGVVDRAFGGLMLFLLLGIPLIALTFLVQLVNLPSRWCGSRWRSVLPLLACVLVLPGIWTVGPRLLVARFYWHRAQYEAVARAIRSGTHAESLAVDEQRLGRWVKAMRAGELEEGPTPYRRNFSAPTDQPPGPGYLKIVGVHFLTVSHGYAGHAGFMRVFDAEAARHLDKGHGADGWSFSKRLTDNWYLVGD